MMSEPNTSFKVAEVPVSWRQATGDLPDVNVWLALSFKAHLFHARATAYWQDACDTHTNLWFCRSTMLGLVRLLSQPKLMGADVLSLPAAMAVYQQWIDTPAVGLLPEPLGLETQLQSLLGTGSAPLPSRLWTDALLAATAESAGLRMVTFDKDFERFNLSRLEVLAPSV
jgi:toxin-antitoxin system PIN domain toxin